MEAAASLPRIDGLPGSPLSDLWDQALQRASPCRDLTGVHGASHHVQHADRLCLGHRLCPFPCSFKDYPHQIMHTRMVGGIDSFPLLAVPFSFCRRASEYRRVTTRLVALAKVFVGSIRGGLGMVTVLGEYFFSGISGSQWPMCLPSDPSWSRH